MLDIWKDIPGYEGLYKVSNTGKVRSLERYDLDGKVLRKGRILKQAIGPYGYARIGLYKDGKLTTKTVHRLVAESFVENPMNKPQVDHISGDPSDNNYLNLRWVTASENQLHSVELRKQNENEYVAKSKRPCVIMKGHTLKSFDSTYEAAKFIGCNPDGVLKVCLGYNKTIYGWHAAYID